MSEQRRQGLADSVIFRPLWVEELPSGVLRLHLGDVTLGAIGEPGELPRLGSEYAKKLVNKSPSYPLDCFRYASATGRSDLSGTGLPAIIPDTDEPARFFEPKSLTLAGQRDAAHSLTFGTEVLYRLLEFLSSPSRRQDVAWEELYRFRCRVARARYYGWLNLYDRAPELDKPAYRRLAVQAFSDWRWILTANDEHNRGFLLEWGLDPEDEVDSILFDPSSGGLRQLLLDPATGQGRLIALVDKWYLPRFHLAGARRLLLSIASGRGRAVPWRVTAARRSAAVLWGGSLALLLGQLAGWWWLPESQGALVLTLSAALAVIGAVVVFLRSFLTDLPLAFPHLPRLAAGIGLGHLLVLSLPSQVPQRLVQATTQGAVVAVCFVTGLALFLTLLYFYAELSRRLGPGPPVSRRKRVLRSLLVLSIGWAHSSLGATWISALLAKPILGLTPGKAIFLGSPGGFDLFASPMFATFASAIALFGGVLVQFLWEDTAPTEPPV